MSVQLTFSETISYEDDPAGIKVLTTLDYGNRSLQVSAKVDTGAEVCFFAYEVGQRLGIPVEQGIAIKLNTASGSIEGFGHEVTIQTGELIFQSVIYFAKYPGLPRNILGRRGWLRNLKLAVVDYDNLLYLSAYNE